LFERGNKRALRTEAAEHNLEAGRNDLLDALRQQTLALRNAFYDLLLAQERLHVGEETAALMRRSVDAAQLRAKKGDIAAADVARLRVDALRAENDLRQAQGDRDKARVALSYFLGLEADAERIHAETAWPNAIELPASLALEAVISSRADVLAAARRLQAAQNNWDLARAARTRDVTVGVQYEHFPGDVSNNTYGITVSVPLFLFYHFDGEIKKAHVAVLSAEGDLMRIRDLARAELLRAQSDLASAQERLRRYSESLLHEAEVAAAGAEYAYRRGAVGVTDLLDARRILYATRLDAISAQAEYAKALAAWQAATQTAGNP
jgi:cobalt-zinc-cadmium efflux system outer membrane protein